MVNVSVVSIEAEWQVNNPELPSGDALEGLSVVPKALLVLRRYRPCAFSVSDMRRPLFPVLKKVHFVHRPTESRAHDAINDLRWKARFCHRGNACRASAFPRNARLALSLSLSLSLFFSVLFLHLYSDVSRDSSTSKGQDYPFCRTPLFHRFSLEESR